MYFLSHYYFDRESEDPVYLLGLTLPDLVLEFNRNWLKPLKSFKSTDSDLGKRLWSGVQRHKALDAAFHESDFFKAETHAITEMFVDDTPPSATYRRYFLSHVLLELLIDRYILKHFSGVPVEFYRSLKSVPVTELTVALQEHVQKERLERFFVNFSKFQAEKHLYRLTNNEAVAAALNRVYANLRDVRFGDEDRECMYRIIGSYEPSLEKKLPTLFNELQQALQA